MGPWGCRGLGGKAATVTTSRGRGVFFSRIGTRPHQVGRHLRARLSGVRSHGSGSISRMRAGRLAAWCSDTAVYSSNDRYCNSGISAWYGTGIRRTTEMVSWQPCRRNPRPSGGKRQKGRDNFNFRVLVWLPRGVDHRSTPESRLDPRGVGAARTVASRRPHRSWMPGSSPATAPGVSMSTNLPSASRATASWR